MRMFRVLSGHETMVNFCVEKDDLEECFKAIEKMSEMVKQLDSAKIRLFLENNKA